MLSKSNAEMLIHAFMTSRLDYCNALLGGCSARLINKLQMVQNAAARVLTGTRKYEHISPVLSTLHWLPISNLLKDCLAALIRSTRTGNISHNTRCTCYIVRRMASTDLANQIVCTEERDHAWRRCVTQDHRECSNTGKT